MDVYGDGREAADAAEAGALMGGLFTDIPALNERLRAAYEQLRAHPQVDPERIGAMGYCLGGALSLHMGRLGMPLRGVVSFHGSLTAAHQAQPGEFKPAVLICHGEADGLVPAEDQILGRITATNRGVLSIEGVPVRALTDVRLPAVP